MKTIFKKYLLVFALLSLVIPLSQYSKHINELLQNLSSFGSVLLSITGIVLIYAGYCMTIIVPPILFIVISEILYENVALSKDDRKKRSSIYYKPPYIQYAILVAIVIELYLSLIHGKLSLLFSLVFSVFGGENWDWFNGLSL